MIGNNSVPVVLQNPSATVSLRRLVRRQVRPVRVLVSVPLAMDSVRAIVEDFLVAGVVAAAAEDGK